MKRLDARRWSALKRDPLVRNYESLFQRFAPAEDVRLFELGIYRGGSLAMWADYFERGIIVGLDIRESVLSLGSDRVKVYCGSQSDTALLSRIGKETAPDGFDVIIDDCSHLGEWSRVS